MARKILSDESNVVRYCRPTLVHEDGRIGGEAFQLRRQDSGLSVHWIQCFNDLSKDQHLDHVRKSSRLTMRHNGRLAELRVGRVKEHIRSKVPELSVIHSPLAAESNFPPDRTHCELRGLPEADSPTAELVGDMIAECIEETHPAVK